MNDKIVSITDGITDKEWHTHLHNAYCSVIEHLDRVYEGCKSGGVINLKHKEGFYDVSKLNDVSIFLENIRDVL